MLARTAGQRLLHAAGARKATLAIARRAAPTRAWRQPPVFYIRPTLSVGFSTEREAKNSESKEEPEVWESPGEDSPGAATEESAELQELRQHIEVLKEQLAELEEKHDNIKLDSKQQAKRHLTDLDNETKYGYTKFAQALLQIPDNLERASSSLNPEDLEKDAELRRMRNDVEKAQALVTEALEYCGIKKMDCMDQVFDPKCHEAMFAMPMPGKDPDVIFHVMEPGYMLYDRNLRAAKVGVTR